MENSPDPSVNFTSKESMPTIETNTTLGITTVGRLTPLLLCLSSVLNGDKVPGKILLRFEGALPSFGDFYLEQIAELARIRGVEWVMTVAKSNGMRYAMDWLLDNCATPFLWTSGDDVVYDYDAFSAIILARDVSHSWLNAGRIAYWCGNKRDVNNRRGYADFSNDPVDVSNGLPDYCPTYHFYDKKQSQAIKYPKNIALDTGFALLDVGEFQANNLKFHCCKRHYNAGGEDTLMGVRVHAAGLHAYFVPSAQAHHLEKPTPLFTDAAARMEAALRTAELLDICNGSREHFAFPWVKPHSI